MNALKPFFSYKENEYTAKGTELTLTENICLPSRWASGLLVKEFFPNRDFIKEKNMVPLKEKSLL